MNVLFYAVFEQCFTAQTSLTAASKGNNEDFIVLTDFTVETKDAL